MEENNGEHKAEEGYFIKVEAEKIFTGKEMRKDRRNVAGKYDIEEKNTGRAV
ncbi:MAG: hypothetical protein J7M11_04265 [Elusimicrobia bacterium]|nr:hypothetical protein [Elusimicrobiota bacterium]